MTTSQHSGGPQVTITWTVPMLRRFRAAYRKAFAAQAQSFQFDGHEFATGYAFYLIEYLKPKLGKAVRP